MKVSNFGFYYLGIYFLNGNGQQIGDVTLVGNVPLTSNGFSFLRYSNFRIKSGDLITSNLVVLQNCSTGSINLPNWDLYTIGNLNAGGDVTCNNMQIGAEGVMS